jgi:hypothetical protein
MTGGGRLGGDGTRCNGGASDAGKNWALSLESGGARAAEKGLREAIEVVGDYNISMLGLGSACCRRAL